jgi:Ohr subfamily peroxiredoxin
VRLVTPKEMGGTEAEGTNPEQMFAAGYAACFSSAMRLVAQRMKLDVEDSSVTAEIGIGPRDGAVGFRLHATLRVELPDLAEEDAKALVERTHQVCPYSNALREGVDVELVIE